MLRDGFPPDSKRRSDEHDEDIYGNLQDLAIENGIEDQEDIYDTVYQEEDEKIYDDLLRHRRLSVPVLEPQSKRDHCIKELLETENNYKVALYMIIEHFIHPLKTVLSHSDRETVFAHIEQLYKVHKELYEKLNQSVRHGHPALPDVFIQFKSKLLVYGDFCSNLPRAQERIDKICENEMLRTKIQECETNANEGKFRLRDLLHVPMQRVLKYHLLMRELMKNTDKDSSERGGLEKALEAMQDLSLYVNEVKRDHEGLQVIQEIQNRWVLSTLILEKKNSKVAGEDQIQSELLHYAPPLLDKTVAEVLNTIFETHKHLKLTVGYSQPYRNQPANTALKDYGRFQKDGELKVLSHMDSKQRNRHIFLFDKVMLMCKAKGETYSYKDAIILGDYRIDEGPLNDVKKTDKWNFPFIMAKENREKAYTFYAKTADQRNKWKEAVTLALDNSRPAAGPNYSMYTFDKPRECDVCGKLLRGVFYQGYLCADTSKAVHKECIGKASIPPIRPRRKDLAPKAEVSTRVAYYCNCLSEVVAVETMHAIAINVSQTLSNYRVAVILMRCFSHLSHTCTGLHYSKGSKSNGEQIRSSPVRNGRAQTSVSSAQSNGSTNDDHLEGAGSNLAAASAFPPAIVPREHQRFPSSEWYRHQFML
ncbi:guanine nucleotide exchange factor VAV2 [Elysia marginata]|uniref:Guanine nucleotide exchange factor VAV2 n=1 Tax=Elysia marginata TaxID=1093978 RepID=A0AAV4FYA6_9GAST|nr:guanine nucleotide exchange factor VAV2 [Elysia marginata]